METIAKVSRGTRMDQIYIPKKRCDLPVGSYVVIKEIEKKQQIKPFYYNIKYLEPIKISIINDIFSYIEADNVIITGSFLDKGFNFNDIDVLIIGKNININYIKEIIENNLGIKAHIIPMTKKALLRGISTDPLYRLMLNRCVSKHRFILKAKKRINYKVLDLHLLKSETLINNFDILTGKEKYELTRNLISIKLFIENKKISNIDSAIESIFGSVKEIKENLVKKDFLEKYKKVYEKLSKEIIENAEQE